MMTGDPGGGRQMTDAYLEAVDYYLPDGLVTNADLAREFPDWEMGRVFEKTGIAARRVAGPDETAADLAERAARRLFDRTGVRPGQVDFLLLCTQTPDYFLPTSACVLQHRLGLPTAAGALDFNLGCSGYVYGLALARGLIVSGQASRVLLLTADTYTKLIAPADRAVRTLFGDGAAATLVAAAPPGAGPGIGPTVFGTDGGGANFLMVRDGGFRHPAGAAGGRPVRLEMNGAEIFTFALRVVPDAVARVLARAGLAADRVDLYVFHQANRYMLEHLRAKMGIPPDRYFVGVEAVGNTVSASIPIALRQAEEAGRLGAGATVVLVGFGVGLSWGVTVVRWRPAA
jgi:3-oxoacyl-[acyl-carrier-protein] synthase III